MTVHQGSDVVGRVYVVVCTQCGTDHRPRLTPRRASDARLLARSDGWRAPTGKRQRHQGDICPDCKDVPNG